MHLCVYLCIQCVRLSLRTKTVTTARTNTTTTTTTRSNKKIFHLNNLQFTSLVAVVTVWWYVWHTTIFYEWIYIRQCFVVYVCDTFSTYPNTISYLRLAATHIYRVPKRHVGHVRRTSPEAEV